MVFDDPPAADLLVGGKVSKSFCGAQSGTQVADLPVVDFLKRLSSLVEFAAPMLITVGGYALLLMYAPHSTMSNRELFVGPFALGLLWMGFKTEQTDA